MKPDTHKERSQFITETLQEAQRELRKQAQELRNLAEKYDVLVEATRELADLVEDTVDGEYEPDSFTTQPVRNALRALEVTE
jgi:signal transduction histidine kinase